MLKTSKDPQHEIMKDGFSIEITVNDKFYVTEGLSPEVVKVKGEGYSLFVFSGTKCQFHAQGKFNLVMLFRNLLELVPLEELKKALSEAKMMDMMEKLVHAEFDFGDVKVVQE